MRLERLMLCNLQVLHSVLVVRSAADNALLLAGYFFALHKSACTHIVYCNYCSAIIQLFIVICVETHTYVKLIYKAHLTKLLILLAACPMQFRLSRKTLQLLMFNATSCSTCPHTQRCVCNSACVVNEAKTGFMAGPCVN